MTNELPPHVSVDADANAADPEATFEGAKSGKGFWVLAAWLAVIAAIASVGVLGWLLLRPGSEHIARDVMACIPNTDFTKKAAHTCPPKGATRVDGLVANANKSGFTVVSVDGKRYQYKVRKPDRPYLNVTHAEQHTALGQPTTVYTKRVGGESIVVYMQDSTLNFQGAQ